MKEAEADNAGFLAPDDFIATAGNDAALSPAGFLQEDAAVAVQITTQPKQAIAPPKQHKIHKAMANKGHGSDIGVGTVLFMLIILSTLVYLAKKCRDMLIERANKARTNDHLEAFL